MSEDTLIEALEQEARSQAGRLLEEARASADAFMLEAATEVASERERRFSELDASMKSRRASLLNAAASRAAGSALEVRHEMIDRAFKEALSRFSSMAAEEYRVLLNRLLEELMDDWQSRRPSDVPVVLVNPADSRLIDTELVLKPDESVSLGVVLATADNGVRFENTVASRLSSARAETLPAMNEMLFDGVFE